MLEFDLRVRRGDFNLEAEARLAASVTGVFGPSGCGKTSLLQSIAGLVKATGSIYMDGQALLDTGLRVNLPAHKRRVGVVFQDNRLFPHLTVESNLRYGRRRDRRNFRMAEIADILEIRHLLPRRPGNLSGGEARRVALGRTLLSDPACLLLDEPLTGLDVSKRTEIIDLLRKVRDKFHVPMIVVSHNLDEILALTEELLVMARGRVLASGPLAEIVQNPAVFEAIGRANLTNMFRLTVAWHDGAYSYCKPVVAPHEATRIAGGGRLPIIRAPRVELREGEEVRFSLQPSDILLSRRPVHELAVENQVAGRVVRVVGGEDHAVCEVDAGTRLFANIPRDTETASRFTAGETVWCLFNSSDLR